MGGDRLARRAEQPLTLGSGDPAADHDQARVQGVHDADHAGGERLASTAHDSRRTFVAGLFGGGHVGRREGGESEAARASESVAPAGAPPATIPRRRWRRVPR